MIFYGIRHKATGKLMPASKRRGFSHWNPSTESGSKPLYALPFPRMLENAKIAQQCINQWAANPNCEVRFSTSYYGSESIGYNVKPDGRKKEDLEVVKIELRIRQ